MGSAFESTVTEIMVLLFVSQHHAMVEDTQDFVKVFFKHHMMNMII